MNRLGSVLPPGFRPNAAFAVSAVCVGTLAVTVLVALVDLTPAAVAPSADPKDVRAFDAQLARHDAAISLARSRFDGRSLFVMPPPPYRPPPPPPPLPPEPPPPPKPVAPVAPADYSGPKPMGMIGARVYFDGIPALSVGEERDGLKVLAVEPPSHVRVAHRGGEYRVPVWDPSDLTALSKRELGASSPIKSVKPVADGSGAGESAGDGGQPRDGANASDSGAAGVGSQPRDGRAADAPAPALQSAPAAPPAPPAPAGPAGPAGPGTDIELPRAEVPSPLSQDDVDAMTRREAQAALAAVSRARGIRDLDEATKTRLREEFDMLIKRVRTAPADEGR
jgi:hypothetical protein